ncbi:hypothetical protein GCM10023170_023890 [Phytohabitans houttuyneae]
MVAMAENSRIKPVERATNRTWDEWLKFMDDIDAKSLDHHAIAVKVFEELDGKIDNLGWWTQAVTVAYEQYIGRRIPGQRPDGTFQTQQSKATKLSMKELMDRWVAFAEKDRDVQGIVEGDLKVSGTENRITWRTKAKDGSAVTITSEPNKKNGTASLVMLQMGLATYELNVEAKERWAAIMKRFLAAI